MRAAAQRRAVSKTTIAERGLAREAGHVYSLYIRQEVLCRRRFKSGVTALG
jgi:hypothetical protein